MNKYYISWFIGALFYSYQYVLRTFPANIEYELRAQFHLTAQQYSTMGSYLLFFYALMQIPIGFLLDKFGIKKILVTSIFISSVGAMIMANAKTLLELQLSRIAIGMGSAGAFMLTLKTIADYMPLKQQAMLMGSTLALGVSGNLLNVFYLIKIIKKHSWTTIMETIGIVGFILFAVSILFVKLPIIKHNSNLLNLKIKKTKILSLNSKVVIYSILTIGLYIPLLVLTDLWGISFISKKNEITHSLAATSLGMLSIALCISSLILPGLCEKINQTNNAIKICTVGIFVIFGFILFGPVLNQTKLQILLVIIGIFSGGSMMCFSQAVKISNAANSGIIIGVVNTLNMLAGSLLIQLIGYLLDIQWVTNQLDSNQVRNYTTSQHVVAITPLWIIVGLCSIVSMYFIR